MRWTLAVVILFLTTLSRAEEVPSSESETKDRVSEKIVPLINEVVGSSNTSPNPPCADASTGCARNVPEVSRHAPSKADLLRKAEENPSTEKSSSEAP